MKTPQAVTEDIRRRLSGKWHTHLTGDEVAFPHAFALGRPATSELRADYSAVHAQTVHWQDWARAHDVVLDYENRIAKGGTTQSLPTHARVASIDHAAAIASGDWPERLARARLRLGVLRDRYPHLADVGKTLRILDAYGDVDFGLLVSVADWYLADPARARLGVTPRQVPIPGVHAKWLQSHRRGVQALTGIDDLGLLPGHPPRIHFTYLDPAHLAAGRRVHDSATAGDSFTPAYLPEVVVISENKDTAIHFPALAGGICVEGVGKGGKTPASFPWIRDAAVLVYWGDMDRDGYEILDGYRADFGRDIDSILMGPDAYAVYEPFGTELDQTGRILQPGTPRPADRLREEERAVYLRLLDPQHTGHRRVEQERIPLTKALEEVELVCRRMASRDDQ
ncbi:Wadjet anti-phage system protein JetD domain-containing protein [Arthrobacter sp. efr-133-R2A-120]|uniref:Wadjet anti-phage system protein JetD domain-containing protein n=1 Tax=Arthrobacter sp. efr-133-R2A-120 TaxID=3040277 RepID=UPI0025502AEC|nr:Wadjet anti-phage system protein JetD domain-containing protein [Arthrobacter sp. efr-133-R2A-120]